MIKINLLPPELHKRKKTTTRIPYIPLAVLACVLFLLLTLFFYGDYLRARSAYKSVKKEWVRLTPLMSQLKAMETKIEVEMRGEKDFLEMNVLGGDSMTRILFWASEFLPSGGWLTELKCERDGEGCRLALKGVVLPSRTQTGIEQIEEYMQKLKAQLPPQAKLALMTSKDTDENGEGTAFAAHWDWGVKKT